MLSRISTYGTSLFSTFVKGHNDAVQCKLPLCVSAHDSSPRLSNLRTCVPRKWVGRSGPALSRPA
jgi:hypothetical protein